MRIVNIPKANDSYLYLNNNNIKNKPGTEGVKFQVNFYEDQINKVSNNQMLSTREKLNLNRDPRKQLQSLKHQFVEENAREMKMKANMDNQKLMDKLKEQSIQNTNKLEETYNHSKIKDEKIDKVEITKKEDIKLEKKIDEDRNEILIEKSRTYEVKDLDEDDERVDLEKEDDENPIKVSQDDPYYKLHRQKLDIYKENQGDKLFLLNSSVLNTVQPSLNIAI